MGPEIPPGEAVVFRSGSPTRAAKAPPASCEDAATWLTGETPADHELGDRCVWLRAKTAPRDPTLP